MWLIVLKSLKAKRGADRFSGLAIAPHGIYFRGKAIRTLFDGLVTRNYQVGSFETICCAAQEGGSAVAGSFIVLKPLKTGRSTDRVTDPALEPHGIYLRSARARPAPLRHAVKN